MKPHFYRIIMPRNVQNGTLELPPQFVDENGKDLSKYVVLKVGEDAPHIVTMKRIDAKVWLQKGWQHFTQRYSIECYYFLLFRYEGGSAFHVFIYGLDCTQIEHLVTDADNDDEDGDDNDDASVGMEFDESVARERVLQKAKAMKCTRPHFISIMRTSYLTKNFLYIPECEVSRYFREWKKSSMKVNCEGGSWYMEYIISGDPQHQVRIGFGWTKFANKVKLKDGDVCVFELLNGNKLLSGDVMEFNVTVFPLKADEEDDHISD